jgi:hypothetical protein
MPGNKCSNCAAYNFECKYEEAAKVCRRSYRLPLAAGPLTCHVRNEGPLKGAYIHRYGVYQNVPAFCIKVCGKSRVTTGKNGEPPATGALSIRTRLCLVSLTVSSCVPMPTSHPNWGRRLIGKALFETPCHAPFRIKPVRPLIDHPHKPRVASSLSLL